MKLPYISKDISKLKIILNTGEIFYAHDIQETYDFMERLQVIKNLSSYVGEIRSAATITGIFDAYCTLLWYLFPEYINAYSLNYLKYPARKTDRNKDLYIIRNNNGFIKVGISENIDARIRNLRHEFYGEFEIIKVYEKAGHKERIIHEKLAEYFSPVINRQTKKYSTECFLDCPEALNICIDICEN